MRRSIKYLIWLIILSSCMDNNESSEQLMNENEINSFGLWKKEYKTVTFQRCLYLGFNRSAEILNVLKMDNSTAQDFPFGLYHYNYIDTIVQPIIQKAKQDSTRRYNKFLKEMNPIERDELNGLPLFKYCLEFYASDKLDSISKDRVGKMKWLWKSND